ncbi:Protein of unknown function DUF861 [Caballeronia glathei]|uniref:Cupin n=1 Tax=Caballeronia glathei TaxID=60547 RepID=A0A069PNN5_9BURK|nr:cupin [Caballeronia glathei]CDY77190.1 Protein of unknown function DUF861 [Caballeronia glathei]
MNRKVLTIMVCCALAPALGSAETIRPVKDSKGELAGAMFSRPDAVKEKKDGNATTDVVTFTSSDSAFQTGMFRSGPAHEEVKGPDGFPYTEFLYFISGGMTLTSADGSVMVVHAGEAVTLPKGWTGTVDTKGYTKLYATYTPADIKK